MEAQTRIPRPAFLIQCKTFGSDQIAANFDYQQVGLIVSRRSVVLLVRRSLRDYARYVSVERFCVMLPQDVVVAMRRIPGARWQQQERLVLLPC